MSLRDDGRPTHGAAAALACVVLAAGFVLLYVVAVRTVPGQVEDAGFFGRVVGVFNVVGPVPGLVRDVAPWLLAGAAVVPAVLAVASRSWRRLAGAALVVVASTAAAQLLKNQVLSRPDLGDHGYVENSYPSGHVAAAAALCVAVVLLWPGGPTPVGVACWGGVVLLVAAANVVSFAHRPSDVLGSLLLVGAVTAATWWVLRLRDAPPVIAHG